MRLQGQPRFLTQHLKFHTSKHIISYLISLLPPQSTLSHFWSLHSNKMESPPLSPTVSSNFTAFANAQASVEEKLADYQPCEPGDDTAEFLRIFFKYLPREGQVNLAEDIDYCRDNTELKQLAESLDTGLLRPMLATGGRTPAITTSPRFGVEDSIENLDSLDLESTRRAAQGKLGRNCLRRDGQRCIVTGYWNTDFDFPPNAVDAPLQAAHVIPFSLGHFENQDERHQMSIIWVNIFRYFPNLRSRLNFTPEDINQEDNVMMMFSPLHEQFGSFHFILEPTSTPHRYHIKLFSKFPSAYKMAQKQIYHDNKPRPKIPSPKSISHRYTCCDREHLACERPGRED
jgi:hypothetical protein